MLNKKRHIKHTDKNLCVLCASSKLMRVTFKIKLERTDLGECFQKIRSNLLNLFNPRFHHPTSLTPRGIAS
jgi:hypothetical protein